MPDVCNDFISSLELSVRAGNLLRDKNVTTFERFKELQKREVMSWVGAGLRTWREIEEAQSAIAGNNFRQSLPGLAISLIERLNDLPLSENGYFIVRGKKGKLGLASIVEKVG